MADNEGYIFGETLDAYLDIVEDDAFDEDFIEEISKVNTDFLTNLSSQF